LNKGKGIRREKKEEKRGGKRRRGAEILRGDRG